jgi:Lon protease-like protein
VPVTDRYLSSTDLPEVLPVFPLRGAILLPRATLTLNVFEPRYLSLVDHALAHARLIAIVQPSATCGEYESPAGKEFSLRAVGCAGRITAFNEAEDSRLLISLTGIARFRPEAEVASSHAFRLFKLDYRSFDADFSVGLGEERVDRPRLLATLRTYLKARQLSADWERIEHTGNERLVNMLSILSPYGPEEKQALLEAPDLKSRAEALMALAEMDLAARGGESGTSLQ